MMRALDPACDDPPAKLERRGALEGVVRLSRLLAFFHITAELRGVDEKDIKVERDGNRLIISGEKKHEPEKDGENWRLIEGATAPFIG
jgi:HSP20 family protein